MASFLVNASRQAEMSKLASEKKTHGDNSEIAYKEVRSRFQPRPNHLKFKENIAAFKELFKILLSENTWPCVQIPGICGTAWPTSADESPSCRPRRSRLAGHEMEAPSCPFRDHRDCHDRHDHCRVHHLVHLIVAIKFKLVVFRS